MSTRSRAARAAVLLAALSCLAAACTKGSGSPPPSAAKVKGGTATVTFISGATPTWIWPFLPGPQYSIYNLDDLQFLLYRPLYVMGGNNNSTTVNYPLSLAGPPVFGHGGTTVTITLKGWKWSDGEPVDAADVAFWLNMLKAEKTNYAGYVPGTLPDNLASYSVTGPNTIVLHLAKSYGQTWFTYNQLSDITPMPLAWDVTKPGAKAGSGGCHVSAARCKAVFSFLNAQSKDTSTYASSPLWAVVDGPFKLTAFSNTGNDTFAPNKAYSGKPKPSISALKYVPYTSDTAQYTALKTGSVDLGFIPPEDLPQKPANTTLPTTNPLGSGYKLQPGYTWGIPFILMNFKNPTAGSIFKQPYVRQALAYLNDQIGMAKAIYRGYGYPTPGPVPLKPVSQWLPPIETAHGGQGPYPFDITKAKSLLTSHGWSEVGGVMTCQNPANCGPGIAKGAQMRFTMDYSTGFAPISSMDQVYKSDASKAGIDISLFGKTFTAVFSGDNPNNKNWQMADYGSWIFNGPGFLPTGEPLFQTGAFTNAGSYSDPKMDRLILAVQKASGTSSFISVFRQYATYAAEQAPLIFQTQSYTVYAQKNTLRNVTYNPYLTFFPEYWYFVK